MVDLFLLNVDKTLFCDLSAELPYQGSSGGRSLCRFHVAVQMRVSTYTDADLTQLSLVIAMNFLSLWF